MKRISPFLTCSPSFFPFEEQSLGHSQTDLWHDDLNRHLTDSFLLPLKIGLAFFQKGAHAFLHVISAKAGDTVFLGILNRML